MSNKDVIKKFIEKRPKVIAAYGYGSGVFKQAGYNGNEEVQLDLIFIVEDIKKWHLENMKKNPNDYSFTGRLFFKNSKKEKLVGLTGVTYQSNIVEDGCVFKYGVVDYDHFKVALSTWNSFYMTGRFQKTIMEFISTDEVRRIIDYNRRSAIIVTLLMTDSQTTIKDLLVRLCGLSYAGDTRMAIAENPRKVLNIVEGSYDEYLKIYKQVIEQFARIKRDVISIEKDKVILAFDELPDALKTYIKEYGIEINDSKCVEEVVMNYLSNLNKRESTYQTLKGLKTNGLGRSLRYAFAKVKKRFKK